MDTSLRIQTLRQYMEEKGLDACILGNPENMQYFSGFQAITYSRPILFVVRPDTTHLIIPALEEAHANLDSTGVKHLHVYYEHPEKAPLGTNPMEVLHGILPGNGLKVGIEFGSMSLKNSRLMESWGWTLSDVGPQVVRMQYIKDEQEKETGKYIRRERYAGACQRSFYVGDGVTEADIKAEFKHGILKLNIPKKENKLPEKKYIAIEG